MLSFHVKHRPGHCLGLPERHETLLSFCHGLSIVQLGAEVNRRYGWMSTPPTPIRSNASSA